MLMLQQKQDKQQKQTFKDHDGDVFLSLEAGFSSYN